MTDPLEPLKPLTQKQQDEFNTRRETASVVQHRCSECGAWYETAKRQTAFQEAFRCDCGNPMTFTVPAMHFERGTVKGIDFDERFESGMKMRDAIANACYWWNKTGRHIMRKDGGKGSDISVSLDPDSDNFSPSGILNGEPWDALDNRERLQIVKAWHHHFISKTQQEGTA